MGTESEDGKAIMARQPLGEPGSLRNDVERCREIDIKKLQVIELVNWEPWVRNSRKELLKE